MDAVGELTPDGFLRQFINNEDYLQNPPLDADAFVDYAKKLGIRTDKKQLEYLEEIGVLFPFLRIERPIIEDETVIFIDKDGQEKWRYAKHKPIPEEKVIGAGKVSNYYSYGFDERSKPYLLELLNDGNLYHPAAKPFKAWANFYGEHLENGSEKTISYYSNFQIQFLELICDELTLKVDFTKVPVQKFKESHIQKRLQEIEDNISILKRKALSFEKDLRILLSIQSVYSPYARSGGKTISLHGNPDVWNKRHADFKLSEVMDRLKIEATDIASIYIKWCDTSKKLLGIKWSHGDFLQLWKNINWSTKDRSLEGHIRRGIEYLQWALMLKRALTEHLQYSILDVDEVHGWDAKDVLKTDADKIDYESSYYTPNNRRAARIADLNDDSEKKNYYHHVYKRLFYLANTLGLDYQPRVMVFVEGRTEVRALHKFFEWRYGNPEHHGIQFYDFGGVDSVFGEIVSLKAKDKRYKKFISNFNNLVSYNLNQWQIIPFVIADGEGSLSAALSDGIALTYDGQQRAFPKKWKFIWGQNDYNRPFGGKSFELANFSNQELLSVLNQYLPVQVTEADVQLLRDSDEPIKKVLGGKYKDILSGATKVEMGEKLVDVFTQSFQPSDNTKVHKRPLLRVFDTIMRLGSLNHPPINRMNEIQNKFEILREFNE